MMIGLVGSALVLPLLSLATDFRSAAFAMVPMWMVFSMIVTPSLAYMAEAASAAGFESYGVVYGVYNMAWAVGLMVSPALGGFLLERVGFEALTIELGTSVARRRHGPHADTIRLKVRLKADTADSPMTSTFVLFPSIRRRSPA